ncbi:hypothetical protein HYX07_03300 [Candidatus Woesearchaeota archaeon]|nr:hypothetical protein [Candidatus Woesearchaeota archaeon]
MAKLNKKVVIAFTITISSMLSVFIINGQEGEECGNLNQACCGSSCNSNLICESSICKPCGGLSQPCCNNKMCNQNFDCYPIGCNYPPCDVQKSGCYRGSERFGFGVLSQEQFSYYLPSLRCVKHSACYCNGTNPSIAHQSDADQSPEACDCIYGSEWSQSSCCGDDIDDCGKINAGNLCAIGPDSSNWLKSKFEFGNIKYVDCIGLEYLSDGSTWLKCDSKFWRKSLSGADYMCIGSGPGSIVECCGTGLCRSKENGNRISAGQPVTIQNPAFIGAPSKAYYCTSDRSFVSGIGEQQKSAGNLNFPDGYVINLTDLVGNSKLRAEDPDEDNLTFTITPKLPKKLDIPQINFRIEVSDGQLSDYQIITVNRI